MQLELPNIKKTKPIWGGLRKGAGRKRANPLARPNVAHRSRPVHKPRHPVHVTMRAGTRGVPTFRCELVRNLFKKVLREQARRAYAKEFQVVHFSIQDDHLHLIVEAVVATDGAGEAKVLSKEARAKAYEAAGALLRRGVSGLAIAFSKQLNRMLGRRGKVWSDRHHRRDLESPTDVRNTILYVVQNYLRHGQRTFGMGVVDVFSSAMQFSGWADPHVTIIETEPWSIPKPHTWLLQKGWTQGGGLLKTSDRPPAAKHAHQDPRVASYFPDAIF